MIVRFLKNLRKQKKISQSDLGKLLGLPQSHVSSIESEAVDPRLSTIVEMARNLDCELLAVPVKHLKAVECIVEDRSSQLTEPKFQIPLEDDDEYERF